MKKTGVFSKTANLLAAMALAVVALGMSADQASAGLILFDDRADFDAAAPGLPVEDFEEAFGGTPNKVGSFPGPLDSTSDSTSTGGAFLLGDILAGVFFSAGPVGEIAVLSEGFTGAPSAMVGANFLSDDLTMTFGAGVNAVGFDLFGFLFTGDITVDVFDLGGGLLSSTILAVNENGIFFGVINWDGISMISFDDLGIDAAELVDNVAFGRSTLGHDVPEPASLALFGFGLLGLGAMRRRRKTG